MVFRNAVTKIFIFGISTLAIYGQSVPAPQPDTAKANQTELTKIELLTPWIQIDGKIRRNVAINDRNCVSLITLEQKCLGGPMIDYGSRLGVNWDIFQLSSFTAQSRMIDLGQHSWDETIGIPSIEPWPELKPGENRNVTFNTSGAGRGQPIDYGKASLTTQVSSTVTQTGTASGGLVRTGKVVKADTYTPVIEAKKNHVYLVHILDKKWNYYLLFRVDDLVRGEKAVLSFKRVPFNPDPEVP